MAASRLPGAACVLFGEYAKEDGVFLEDKFSKLPEGISKSFDNPVFLNC